MSTALEFRSVDKDELENCIKEDGDIQDLISEDEGMIDEASFEFFGELLAELLPIKSTDDDGEYFWSIPKDVQATHEALEKLDWDAVRKEVQQHEHYEDDEGEEEELEAGIKELRELFAESAKKGYAVVGFAIT